ncbi:MAG: ribbon-helix-helix domain-containing protein [Pseudomonadota bacterium]
MTVKRSVTIAGHRTSVSLEKPFWEALQQMADRQGKSISALVAQIDADRAQAAQQVNLSSALRIFVLKDLKAQSTSG